MRCYHPLSIVLDGTRQFVPCGKCNFCLEQRRAHWSFRLQMEEKSSTSSYFITLTYDDQKIPKKESGEGTLCKKHVQLFLKRLRKFEGSQVLGTGDNLNRKAASAVRYYAVGEYGTRTERPHYHIILFNVRRETVDRLEAIWGQGNIMIGDVTPASIHYTTKFHVNALGEYPGRDPPFCLMSRKPGIGAGYLETHAEWHMYHDRLYTQVNGFKRSLPRYYKSKIFAERVVTLPEDASEVSRYYKEIERLSKEHPSPHEYYNEVRKNAHDKVKHKSNLNNKL